MNEPTKYYEAGNDPDQPDWWSVIVDRIEQRQEWAIVHMRRENEYEVWAEGKHYGTRKTMLEAEQSMQEARRDSTSYTDSSTETLVAEKEQTKEKPILGIILVPLLAGGIAGSVSAALSALPLSGLLSCGIGLLHMFLIVIAGLTAAWHSGHVRSGTMAGAIWSVVVVTSAFLRSGKDLSALSAPSILAIALALFLGTLFGLAGGSFSQRE